MKEEMLDLCRRDRVEKEEAEEREETAKDEAHRIQQEPAQEMAGQLPDREPVARKSRRIHINRSTRIALVLAVVFMGVVSATVIYVGTFDTAPTQENILFEDEFDGKIDDRWIALYDEDHILVTTEVDGVKVHEVKMVPDGYKPFKVENGSLTSANAQWTPMMAVGEADWTNYSVEMDVTEHKGCSVVVLMRCAVDRYGNYRGVMFLAGRYLDLAGWWTCEGSGGRGGGTGWNPISIAPRVRNGGYHLRVDAIGNEFSAYIDGKLRSRVTIDGYPSGRAGVGFGILSTYYDAPCPVYVSYLATVHFWKGKLTGCEL